MARIVFVVCTALLASLSPAYAVDYSWSVASSGNWNTASNWGGGPPGSGDNATLGTMASAYTVQVTDGRSINNFDLNYALATLTVSGTGSWTINGAANINFGTFNFTGGTMTVNGTFTTAATASSNWSGGNLTGTGTLFGTFNVNGGGQISGTSLKNGGTLAWNSGGMLAYSATVVAFTNLAAGVIDFKANGQSFYLGSDAVGTIVNQGTLRKSAGTGTAGTSVEWQVDFQNGSSIDVQTGVLKLAGGGILRNGTINLTGTGTAVLAGGTFNLANGSTFTAPANAGNPLNLTGGTIQVDGTLAGTLSWTSGALKGGVLNLPGTLNATINVTDGGGERRFEGIYLQNSGTINWSSGSINSYSLTTNAITNVSGGLIDFKLDGAAFILGSSATGTIVNQSGATLRKSGGTGAVGTTVEWQVDFQNGSNVNVQSGQLKFIGGGTLRNGTINLTGTGLAVLAGGTFTIANGSTFTGPTNSGNPLNLTGGTIAVNGTLAGTLSWTSGELNGGIVTAPGLLTGTINVTDGGGERRIGGIYLQNNGVINWTTGSINAYSLTTDTLTNLSGGLIDFKADGAAFILGSSATGTILNQPGGTIRKSGGATALGTTVEWQVDFTNGNNIDVQTGTLKFIGGGTLRNGTFNLTGSGIASLAGGTFTIASGTNFASPANSGNPLQFSGGALAVTGTLSGVLNWTGGALSGNTLAGTINVFDGVNDQTIGVTTLRNTGTINWNSGSIFAYSITNALLTNTSTGVMDFKADGAGMILGSLATGTLVNEGGGILRKSGGTASSTTIDWFLDFRSGTIIDAQAGSLFFNGSDTLPDGTITLTGTAVAGLNSGTHTITSGGTFTSVGTAGGNFLRWTGGVLTGGVAGGTLAGTLLATSGTNQKFISNNTLFIAGSLAWTGGAIVASSGTVATTVLPGGEIDFRADGTAFSLGGSTTSATIVVYGTLRKSAGVINPTAVGWAIDLQNGATLNPQAGTLNFTGGGTLEDGTTTVTGTAIAALNAGTFTIASGGIFTSASTGTNFLRWTGGTLTGGVAGGTLAGTLIAASSTNTKTVTGNTLFNTGTLAWTGGAISSSSGTATVLTNLLGGVIDFRADGTAFTPGGAATATIVNQGTLRKSLGVINPTSVGWAVDFRTGGILDAVNGTLNLDGGGTLNTGTTTVTGTAIVALNNGTFTVASGRTFTAAGTAGNYLYWTGGTLTGGVAGGILAGNIITDTGTNTKFIASNTLFNSANITWLAGPITSANSGTVVFTNQSAGVIDVQSDGTVFTLGTSSTGSLVNQGTIKKTAGTLNPAIISGWVVNNSGTIQVTVAGTLNFTAAVTNSGIVTMANGATIGGTINSNSGGVVKGPAGGTGTLTGPQTFNTGSFLQPGGGSAGKLVLSSTLTLNSGSTYSVKLAGNTAGTGYSQVQVTGQVALGGATLAVDSTGFTPNSADKYILIQNDSPSAITGTLTNGSTVNFGIYTGQLTYTGNASTGALTGGNDLIMYSVLVAVPEPTGIVVLCAAGAVLLKGRRTIRRRMARN